MFFEEIKYQPLPDVSFIGCGAAKLGYSHWKVPFIGNYNTNDNHLDNKCHERYVALHDTYLMALNFHYLLATRTAFAKEDKLP